MKKHIAILSFFFSIHFCGAVVTGISLSGRIRTLEKNKVEVVTKNNGHLWISRGCVDAQVKDVRPGKEVTLWLSQVDINSALEMSAPIGNTLIRSRR